MVFPAHRIMHTGDAFPNKSLPIMDANNGGSGVDFPATLTKAAGVANVDTIINGHTPDDHVRRREGIRGVRRRVRDDVQNAKKDGKTVDEVVIKDLWKTPATYTGYNPKPARLQADVEVVCAETK